MLPSDMQRPVRVALRNDYELVVVGLAELLAPHADRVEVVEAMATVDGDLPVDVTLYDTFSQTQVDGSDIDELLSDSASGKVVIYTWNTDPRLIDIATQKGVHGYLPKSLNGKQLADALVDVMRGQVVVMTNNPRVPLNDEQDQMERHGSWPGKVYGLTAREAEVIALITQGLRNQEIADRAAISINSVKTHIRAAYRKMGVKSRSQAVLWGVEHGMLPDAVRLSKPALQGP
ncbi:response regulator transcription factor [Flexivirga meconopsidis]|uniref:response regulator transcription factor n=1 Tax=Flexivirga meconopsidis TaxID=2977121 RepID=UPI00223EB81A|nr:response regulator transcription factor [Flexivirga meconopsidis]